MDHEDPAIRLASLSALKRLTHKDLGTDPADWRRELKPTLQASGAPASPGSSSNPPAMATSPARPGNAR
jgi:hypothetical protein